MKTNKSIINISFFKKEWNDKIIKNLIKGTFKSEQNKKTKKKKD